jgi:hypothetical protein
MRSKDMLFLSFSMIGFSFYLFIYFPLTVCVIKLTSVFFFFFFQVKILYDYGSYNKVFILLTPGKYKILQSYLF